MNRPGIKYIAINELIKSHISFITRKTQVLLLRWVVFAEMPLPRAPLVWAASCRAAKLFRMPKRWAVHVCVTTLYSPDDTSTMNLKTACLYSTWDMKLICNQLKELWGFQHWTPTVIPHWPACPVLHRHICAHRVKPQWAVSGLAKADRSANANVFPLIRINDHMVAWLTKFPNSQGRNLLHCQTLQNFHLRETI